ncbi:MAG: CHAT domain-containing protein [bacterium]|nr:CHAT domain-containing protein [bacterium]
MSGANAAIRGEDNQYAEDGILTALEVSGLNLGETDLVTLSACETGLGSYISGEGVFGLRRAFHHAGAESVLMSLWKVPDKETTDLMVSFYRIWLDGQPRQTALRRSVLNVMSKTKERSGHSHPLYWGGFVMVGCPE